MTPLQRRDRAVRQTLLRFKDKPFKWGKNDCGRMVAFHLRAIGKPVNSAKAGTYHSLLGAKKALKRVGFDDLVSLMDAHFGRIPPAAALTGDILQLPGEGNLGALAVAVGNGRILGYHQDYIGAAVMQPIEPMAAWRVLE